jgi:Pvc16 N-terminal domain
MIQDVDDTVKEMLVRKVPIDTTTVDIKFEMPTAEWAASVAKPTLNVFLYDLRESHELRSNQRILARSGGVGSERRAPVRIDLTYLITAWTTDVADEHRLLGNVLVTLLRYPLLPDEVLKGAMQVQPLPLQAWIAQPERTPNAWDFWSSLDGRLKAGISYAVTASLEPHPVQEVGLVTEKLLKLHDIGA